MKKLKFTKIMSRDIIRIRMTKNMISGYPKNIRSRFVRIIEKRITLNIYFEIRNFIMCLKS